MLIIFIHYHQLLLVPHTPSPFQIHVFFFSFLIFVINN